MAEQLQGLLDRIQRDGVDKAKAEADVILESARQKAAKIIADAEKAAEAQRQKAEKDSKTFADRGKKALEQAARDVLLSLGESINRTVQALVRRDVGQALSAEALAGIIAEVVKSYTKADSRDVAVLVPEDKRAAIIKHVNAALSGAAAKGLTISGDERLTAGFRVVLKDKNVEHDFSQEAITRALSQLLRPAIADIVKSAAEKA